MRAWTRGQPVMTLDTPALILDIGAAERNIRKMADLFAGRPVRLRPHVKTHKTPLLAHKQLAAGAIGITCAKLGEAAARAISDAARAAGICVPTLIDLDVGQGRTGVPPGEPAVALARTVGRMPGLAIVGVQGYEGHLQHVVEDAERGARCRAAMKALTDTADALRAEGFVIDIVSTGGTGTHAHAGAFMGGTEIQAGSYVTW